jgi:Phage integrase family
MSPIGRRAIVPPGLRPGSRRGCSTMAGSPQRGRRRRGKAGREQQRRCDHALALGPARRRTTGEVRLHLSYQGAVGVRIQHADYDGQIAHPRGRGLRCDPRQQVVAKQGQGVASEAGARRGIGIEPAVLGQAAKPQAVALLGLPDRMDRVDQEQHRKLDVRNVRYRDGLLLAILAARAFRRGNLAQMRVGQHIAKVDGVYVCSFGAAETKNRRALVEPLPMELTRYIDRYLAEIRPALLRGHTCDAFWVSTYRAALSEHSIYLKVCATTEEELGVRLSPHLFRDALATGIATDDPEHIRMASRLLGHADPRTTERHYIHAQALIASRRYNGVVLPLRHAAVAASIDQEDSSCA